MEAFGSQSIPSSEAQSNEQVSSDINIRQKRDIAWRYVTEGQNSQGKRVFICNFCQKQNAGGGINRMKQHLAGTKGNVDSCKKVPSDVRFLVQGALQENVQKAKQKKGCYDDISPYGKSIHEFEGDDVQEIPQVEKTNIGVGASSKGKRKATGNIEAYFKYGTNDSTQPSIKAVMQSKERWNDTDMAIAMWFYDACIPLNAVNSSFFQVAVGKIASMGHGYKAPTYHALRVNLLRDCKQQIKMTIDAFQRTWAETGCTIMGDGWTDTRQRPLINFLVYCPKGISFIKSVDASDFTTDANALCNLFSKIIEMVGSQNVVHIVIDNGANYKAAGKKIHKKYPDIYWSPCAAHCINLIMKDIAEMPTVQSLAILASKITVFVYNHKWVLNWLRKQPNWTEIVRPGATRFATTFLALKSLHDHKDYLQALVICSDFKKFLMLSKGREVKQIILDENFWRNCLIMSRFELEQ